MALNAATRLGPYEILAPLGAGGMGEVYRARDTRLSRDVAIKVLPQHLSTQPEIRARFEREAKAISSLNHPHICTLFDVGRAPGEAGSNGIDYLVMELVEGETLAARLTKGALPPAEVLKIGAQIADALDRAHRAGIVHRDLKPGNIMLTRGGAKLMDFGLARATGLAGAGSTTQMLTQSPTMAAPLTAEGTIIGTFLYMAPEQLEGREADERSDLWALGCVLYEMATGRRAFEGRSQATLITAIMSTEPPLVSQLVPLAPQGLDHIVRTCLTKDPEERARSAHDLKLQLLGLQGSAASHGVSAPARSRDAKGTPWPWAVAAVATIAAVAMAVMLTSRERSVPAPVHVSVEPEVNHFLTKYPSSMGVSPDGQSIAYCATDSNGVVGIWVRRFDSPEATWIGKPGATGTSPVSIIFWSADSRSIGTTGNVRKLVTMPVNGGTPTEVCALGAARGATWNRQGVIVVALTAQGPLYRVPASGGEPVQVTWLDSTRSESGHRFPVFLPDGEHFLYVSMPRGPEGYAIYAGSLGSRQVKKIMTAQSAVIYAAPGYLLSRRNGKLAAQRFDAKRLEVHGDPVLLGDAPMESDIDGEPIASASDDGRLVTLRNPPRDTQLRWLDRTGAPRGILPLPNGTWMGGVLSPDDRFAAVSNGTDLWRVELGRGLPLRLTSGNGVHTDPVWSPDGRQIACTRSGRGREEIVIMNSDGSGEPKVLPSTDHLFKLATDWSSAGLMLAVIDNRTLRDVILVPYPEGGAPRPIAATSSVEAFGKVSPDGRWVAYMSNEAGPLDVYLKTFPEGAHKTRVTNGGVDSFWWMPGGTELCYRTQDGIQMMSVKLTRRGEDMEVEDPRVLFRYPPDAQWSDMTHDGERFLVTISSEAARSRRAHVILNWPAMMGH